MKNQVFEKIKQAKEINKLIVFCGSGLSRNLKRPNGKTYPDWLGLVNEIIELSFIKESFSNGSERIKLLDDLNSGIFNYQNVLTTLNKLKDLKPNFEKAIKQSLLELIPLVSLKENETVLETFHKKLLYISNNRIITTNYDDAFEKVYSPFVYNKYVNSDNKVDKLPSEEEFLYKLHGDILSPDTCVLFEADYDKIYTNEGLLYRNTDHTLKTLLGSNNILFIGFSINDFEIRKIIKYLNSLGTQNFKERLFFISSELPEIDSIDFTDSWIKVEKEERISESYKKVINELYNYCRKGEISKIEANLKILEDRSSRLGTYHINDLITDIDRCLEDKDTKGIFTTENEQTNSIFQNILNYIIKLRFLEKQENDFIDNMYRINQIITPTAFYQKNQSLLIILGEIINNQSSSDDKYKSYKIKLNTLNLIVEKINYIDIENRTVILESNIIQQSILSELDKLREELIEEYNEKEKPIRDFFKTYKKTIKQYIDISYDELHKNIHIANEDKRFDVLDSDLEVSDYILLKASNLIASAKHKPNLRFSLIEDKKSIIGFIDKNVAFILYENSQKKIKLSKSSLLKQVRISTLNSKKIIDLVNFFSCQPMIDYSSQTPRKLPSIFVNVVNSGYLTYKDVLFYIDKIAKNDKFINHSIKDVFSLSHAETIENLVDINTLTTQSIEEYILKDENTSGFILKVNKKVAFLNLTTYHFWLKFLENDKLTDTTPISKIHKELTEMLQVFDGKKSTFIIEPSTKYILEIFDCNYSLSDLIKYFMRPETLEVIIVKVQDDEDSNTKYLTISFNQLFEEIKNYFIKL